MPSEKPSTEAADVSRPVPAPETPKPPEKTARPPELPADALSQVSRRVSVLEQRPPTQLGAGAVFALAALAGGLVLGIFFLVTALVRSARKEAQQ